MDVAGELEKRAKPLLDAAGLELVDVHFRPEDRGWVVRFFIDKPGGFGLADCAEWSDRLGDMVEESGLVHRAYVLEVSSPGLARPLKNRDDFERFRGIDAVIKTHAPIGPQRHFAGRIEGVEGDEVILLDRTNGVVRIPIPAIAAATLDPNIG